MARDRAPGAGGCGRRGLGIGPSGRTDGPVAAPTTRVIMRAMAAAGVLRLIAVSAAPAGPVLVDDGFLHRRVLGPLIGALLRDTYADLAALEEEIARSGVRWTVMRPTTFANRPLSGSYRSSIGGIVPRGYSISRADVARAMVSALDDPATVRRAVGVAY